MDLDAKERQVRDTLAGFGRVVVAYSGGVDSSLLLALAVDLLGERALAATAVSPSLAAAEREAAVAFARSIGARHEPVRTNEFEDPRYLENAGDRCYWCRSSLVAALRPLAARERATLAYGAILDDLGDDRPGMRAAAEGGLRAPLVEAGFSKADVRDLARRLGLPMWDKPAMACLASRVPAGTAVSEAALRRVERAEGGLRELGWSVVRVRDHGDTARLELGADEMRALGDAAQRERVASIVRGAGYARVLLDRDGYRPAGLSRLRRLDGDRLVPLSPDPDRS